MAELAGRTIFVGASRRRGVNWGSSDGMSGRVPEGRARPVPSISLRAVSAEPVLEVIGESLRPVGTQRFDASDAVACPCAIGLIEIRDEGVQVDAVLRPVWRDRQQLHRDEMPPLGDGHRQARGDFQGISVAANLRLNPRR